VRPITRSLIRASVMLASLSILQIGAAQTVADFKAASQEEGCRSVPYPSKRTDCEGLQREIDNYCKTDVIDCDVLMKKKIDLKTSIDNRKRRIAELENKKAPLVRERDAQPKDQVDQIRSYDEKIKDVDEDIGEVKGDLEKDIKAFDNFDRDNRADVAYERAQKCFDYRTKSNKFFADVIEDLYKEPTKTLGSSSGEGVDYDATKRELEAYAVKIIDGIKGNTSRHETAAKDADGRIKNCKAILDLKMN
jgi:hypothetical protein